MIVAGLDLSFTRPAIVAIEWNGDGLPLGIVYQETLKISGPSYPLEQRLADFMVKFITVVVAWPKPELVAIEGSIHRIGRYSHGDAKRRGLKTLAMLQELNGVAKAVLGKWHYSVLEVSPTAMKKAIGGKGDADKALVAQELQERWGIRFPGDENHGFDLYDAAGLAVYGLSKRGFRI